MANKRKQTFSEMVSELRSAPPSAPTGDRAVRPGGFNLAGEFFTPEGALLEQGPTITPEQAAALVTSGAALAFEGCGCGGGGGCEPDWFTNAEVAPTAAAGKPRFIRGYGSPTWIDHWTSTDGDVVFAHGDVRWGDLLE